MPPATQRLPFRLLNPLAEVIRLVALPFPYQPKALVERLLQQVVLPVVLVSVELVVLPPQATNPNLPLVAAPE
jgi:hypothetical protein